MYPSGKDHIGKERARVPPDLTLLLYKNTGPPAPFPKIGVDDDIQISQDLPEIKSKLASQTFLSFRPPVVFSVPQIMPRCRCNPRFNINDKQEIAARSAIAGIKLLSPVLGLLTP